MNELKSQFVDIDSISPYLKNAKIHSETQIKNVAESIEQFGWKQPIVCDKDGVIIVGHCRYMAAQRLGMEEVPVLYATDLTPTQVRKYRLLDNRTNESPWDIPMLTDDLDGLDFDGFDIDWGIDLDEPYAAKEVCGNQEIDLEEYGDEKFECECPRCGFKFNQP